MTAEIERLRASFDRRESLLGPLPKRTDVAEIAADFPDPEQSVGVRVWRNHALEPLQPLIDAFARTLGLQVDLTITDYDDSLSFISEHPGPFDCELIFFDLGRLAMNDAEADGWVRDRAHFLESATETPVLVVTLGGPDTPTVQTQPNVWVVRCEDVAPGVITDERREAVTGTRLSRQSQMLVSRALVYQWLAAFAGRMVKAIFVDLDDTLHHGVLGEDGLEVTVGPGHHQLQQRLKEAKEAGVLLCIVSKNELADVVELLDLHPDYVLREEDFLFVRASWQPKADVISDLITSINVGSDSCVFIDDNFAELASVHLAHPPLGLIEAHADATTTFRHLDLLPGLQRVRVDDMATGRAQDLRANEERRALLDASERIDEYLKAASPRLEVLVNDETSLERLADLSARSNQFNLALARTDGRRLHSIIERGGAVVAGSVSDRFSDSGIVLGVVAEPHGDRLRVIDLFMSCRALGRGIETCLIGNALSGVARVVPADELDVAWVVGDRNAPALDWLRSVSSVAEGAASGSVTLSRSIIDRLSVVPEGVEVVHEL